MIEIGPVTQSPSVSCKQVRRGPGGNAITGEVRPYATTWTAMLGLLGTMAAVAPLLPPSLDARLPRTVALGVLLAELAIAVALAGRPRVHDSQVPPARAMSDSLVNVLGQHGTRHAPYRKSSAARR